jgi:hypothetical protein
MSNLATVLDQREEYAVPSAGLAAFYPSGHTATRVFFNAEEYIEPLILAAGLRASRRLNKYSFYDRTKASKIFLHGVRELEAESSNKVNQTLLLSQKKKADDPATDIYMGILEMVIDPDPEFPISIQAAMNALKLVSDLVSVTYDIDYYASPDDSITFELFYDGKRATIEQNHHISLVISKNEQVQISKFPNGSEGIENLKELIINF